MDESGGDDGDWDPATELASSSYDQEIARSRRDDADDSEFEEEVVTTLGSTDAQFDAVPTRTEPTRRTTPKPMPATPGSGPVLLPKSPGQSPMLAASSVGSGPVTIPKSPTTGPMQAQVPAQVPGLPPPLPPPLPPRTGPVQAQVVASAAPMQGAPSGAFVVSAIPAAPPKALVRRRALPFSPLAAVLGLITGAAFGYYLTHSGSTHVPPAAVAPAK